jgi:tRNA modification GTPase
VSIRSKHDLGGDSRGVLATSAVTGEGIAELKRAVLAAAGVADGDGREDALITTARQHDVVSTASAAFVAAVEAWSHHRGVELVALELRQAVHALAQLRGVEVGERVLDEVFARFCIGK